MQHSTRQNVNRRVNQFSSKTSSQAIPWNLGINGYMLRETAPVWNNSSREALHSASSCWLYALCAYQIWK